jgi:diguanylate cyclase (GGDEF)-like protein/PAS domain S-box-containing protein
MAQTAFTHPLPPTPSLAQDAPAVRVPQALLSLLERTTSDLITLPSAALDTLIDRTLADIGTLFGADRAYLFLATEDGGAYDNTHEWCAPGVEPQRENLQGLPTGMFPWWVGEMVAGRDIVLASLADLPPQALEERALLEPQGIQSLLALPLSWRGRFWGLAGFDHVSRQRSWTSDEVAVLRLVVSAFAQGFERRRLDARLGLASTVFEHAQEGIFVNDAQQRVLDVNPTFSEITGLAARSVIGQPLSSLLPAIAADEIWRTVAAAGLWRGELEHLRPDGVRRHLRITVSAVRDLSDGVSAHVGVFSDITELREQAQRLRELAYHDPLTQLPNRALLADRMRQALVQARRTGEVLAVALLDLDGFKPVNDTHGHAAGDSVLVELAQRLGAVLREGDTVARMGGDEFVLLLPGLQSAADGQALMERVMAEIERPITLGTGTPLRMTASIGLRTVPPAPEDADTLLREADQALYTAKREGRARIYRFDAEDERLALQRQARVADIARALAEGEMRLHFQPVVDLRTGRAVRAEALVRWARPGGALVPPGEWLPLIEHTPLIVRLGEWVLATALRACAAWQAADPGVGVSVNVSAQELCDPDHSVRLAAALAREPSLSPALVQLEVVESAPMSALPAAMATMRACNALGTSFALDDFGTGYSSLAYLKTLPVSVVKIDRSFVFGLASGQGSEGRPGDRRIVQGIVELVGGYGLTAVGEGVETAAQARELLAAGCTLGQGYGICRPVEAEGFVAWLLQPQRPFAEVPLTPSAALTARTSPAARAARAPRGASRTVRTARAAGGARR